MDKNKYRGLTLKTKRWAYGYYCQVEGKHYIILDDAELCMIECSVEFGIFGFVEVDPKTVGQFTGLLDKNDKEGWEADIAKDKFGIYEIVWEDECGSWGKKYAGQAGTLVGMVLVHSEIIGDIHQNPELIEETNA